MSFFKKTQASLGVDIGAGGIKLVELRKAKGRPQLWTYAIVDEDLDIHIKTAHEKSAEELLAEKKPGAVLKKDRDNTMDPMNDSRIEYYASLLKKAASAAHVTTRRATASLPVSYVFHAIITLPGVPDKELSHHVRAKVKKMLPRPIDEMQIVHQVIPTNKKEKAGDIHLLVTAAPKDVVRFYTSIFQKAGFQLEELETEAFALERSLVGRDKSTSMIVDIGAERTNFFIVDQGVPVTHRSIQIGGRSIDILLQKKLGIEQDIVSSVKADISRVRGARIPNELFASVIDPIIKEIEYNFDLYFHQTNNKEKHPEKIILTGGSSVFPPIIEIIESAFQMKVFVGDPWARVVYQQGLKVLLDNFGPRMAVSIGLALRGIL